MPGSRLFPLFVYHDEDVTPFSCGGLLCADIVMKLTEILAGRRFPGTKKIVPGKLESIE